MIEFFETGGIVAHGKLKLEARERRLFDQAMTQFREGFVTIRVERQHPRRTDRQNRYWHGVVIPLFAQHCGESFDEMKQTLALELLPVETRKLDGSIVVTPGHTSDLNVPQFNDLIRRAQQLGATMDIFIPDPAEAVA